MTKLPRTRNPLRRASDPKDVRVTKRWWRDWAYRIWGLVLLGVLVLGIFAGFGYFGGLVKPPPISEQIEKEKSNVLRGPNGRHVVVDERVHFHGGEADSWVLVVQDRKTHDEFDALARSGKDPPPPSDELRVYDVQGGRLKLKLHFQPKPVNKYAAAWRTIAGSTFATDYDKDRSKEVIAGYEIPGRASAAAVPFAIAWGRGGYRLEPLTPEPPELSRPGLDRAGSSTAARRTCGGGLRTGSPGSPSET